MDKIIEFKYDYDKIYEDFKKNAKGENMQLACSLFALLDKSVHPESYLLMAGLYSKINDIASEVDNLLKFLTTEKIIPFNPASLLYKLNLYFYVYNGLDRFDFYRDICVAKLGGMFSKEDLPSPNEPIVSDGLKLLDDNDKLRFFTAMDLVVKGKENDAEELLNQMEGSGEFYQRGKNLKAMVELSKGNVKDAENTLMNLIKEGCVSKEIYASLYRTFAFDKDLSPDLLRTIGEINSGDNNYDLVMLKVFAAIKQNNYDLALNELKKVDFIFNCTTTYMENLALCYYKTGDMINLKNTLKKYLTIYPKEAKLKYILSKLETGEDVVEEFLVRHLKSGAKTKLKKHIKAILNNTEYFKSLTKLDAIYLFNLSLLTNSFEFIKKCTKIILKTEFKEVVLDALISVETDHVCRQIVYQSILEECYEDSFSTLVNGYLIKAKVGYPKLFKISSENINKDKLDYLKCIYSQCYSLLFFAGSDTSNLCRAIEPIINHIFYLKENSKEDEFIRDSDRVVYMLASYYDSQNKQIEESFKVLSSEQKQEIKNFLQQLLQKLDFNKLDKGV